MKHLSLEEVASRAGAEDEYVRRLAELGALKGGGDGYGETDVHRVALLHAWEAAGLAPDSILTAVRQGELSFAFLETPGWAQPERPDRTYREVSDKRAFRSRWSSGFTKRSGFRHRARTNVCAKSILSWST